MKSKQSVENWEKIIRDARRTTRQAAEALGLPRNWLENNSRRFPFLINRYWLDLINSPGDPIGLQSIPDERELTARSGEKTDPLEEEKHRKAPLIIHRYPDRVLFLVSNLCPVHCRFCTRRRLVGKPPFPTEKEIEASLVYLKHQSEIREVILSGGDPLLLSDRKLVRILSALRQIDHVKIIRIGTRAPVTLPPRVTTGLVRSLRPFRPIFILTQFNHPKEITPASTKACTRFVDSGFPVLNQSVLLKGVNDSEEVMLELVEKLVSIRVLPYYLHQLDPVAGTRHFAVSVERGKEIIRFLREHTGGIGVPTYVFDDPEAPGKTPLAC